MYLKSNTEALCNIFNKTKRVKEKARKARNIKSAIRVVTNDWERGNMRGKDLVGVVFNTGESN